MPKSRDWASSSRTCWSSGSSKPLGYLTPWLRPILTVPRPSGETVRPVRPRGRWKLCRLCMEQGISDRCGDRRRWQVIRWLRQFRLDRLPGELGEGLVAEIRGQGQLGGPADQRVADGLEIGIVRAHQAALGRLGAGNRQGRTLTVPQIDPGQQLLQLLARPLDQLVGGHVGALFSQVAAQVPAPLTV